VDTDAAEQLYRALLRDDAAGARSIIQGRYLTGAEIAAIADGLIRPVLERIGKLWRSRDMGIVIEHRAVDSCVQVLSELRAWMPAPPSNAPATVTAAGPADPYLLPPLLASLCLAEQGWRTMNLGPNTPFESILAAGQRYHASLCCVSVSVDQPGDAGLAWLSFADALKRRGIELVLGGRCVDMLTASLPGRVRVIGSMAGLADFAASSKKWGSTKQRPTSANCRQTHRA
jgi:hypothetical protein